MSHTHVIAVDSDDFVNAGIIPNEIAALLWPVLHEERVLCLLQKKTRIGDKAWRFDDLDEADWQYLGQCWQHLPPIAGATQQAFRTYQAAFDAAPAIAAATGKPAWELVTAFHDPEAQQSARRSYCRTNHFNLLDQAIRAGKLPALTEDRLPADALAPGVIVAFEEMRRYLEPLGFILTVAKTTAAPGKETTPHKQDNAIAKPLSRQQAQEDWILHALRARGIGPLRLPKTSPGRPGIRDDIWHMAQTHKQLFQSRNVFDMAWKRLRGKKELVSAEG